MHLLGGTSEHPKWAVVGFDVGSHGGISMRAMCVRHIHGSKRNQLNQPSKLIRLSKLLLGNFDV
jgi:hypothetical protein